MPRQSRIVIPGLSHHITQRGNYRLSVFDRDSNYKRYCQWLNEYSNTHGLDIIAYCLMTNHIHVIAVPAMEDTLSKVFNTVHMRYAHYLNRQRKVKGHLWQSRFYSCVLDDEHLYRAIRYVENNPVRARIVKQAASYKYSSAQDHLGLRDKPLVKLKAYKDIGKDEWLSYLKENDSKFEANIRLKTSRGLVVGTGQFIKKLESQLKRSLKCLPWGRPKKS